MTKVYPSHLRNLIENFEEVEDLIEIHRRIAGKSPGRKFGLNSLNKSSIILLCAGWEFYIEDLLENSFNYLLTKSTSHNQFAAKVLVQASQFLVDDNDKRRVWELAGSGWKRVIEEYKNNVLKQEINFFHVPRTDNINELFEKILGIKSITSNFFWNQMSNEKALFLLDEFVNLRGEISHKVKTKNKVWKKDIIFYKNFLSKLAIIMHNRVTDHLDYSTGSKPWDLYSDLK